MDKKNPNAAEKKGPGAGPTFVTALVICLLAVCMTPTASNVMGSLPRHDLIEPPRSPEPPGQKDREAAIIRDRVKPGGSISQILDPVLPLKTVYELNRRSRGIFCLQNIRPGHAYQIHVRDGRMVRFEYDICPAERLVIQYEKNDFSISREPVVRAMSRTSISGTVATTLYHAVKAAGESGILAGRLAEIFAWDIDFIRDIRPGDRFRAVVETYVTPNGAKGYGHILAAEFTCRGTTFRAFYHENSDQVGGYYDEKGRSLHKTFLKAPLSFSRISSGFSLKRMHPILKSYRSHPAIDYAAPEGTPIKTVGDGKVAAMGTSPTMGNHVMIRHANGYVTRYFHLSRFARGLARNKPVAQGDLIGYVGQTGYATGPHLCFRMTKDGKPVNPLTLHATSARPVPEEDMAEFLKLTAELNQAMDNARADASSVLAGTAEAYGS